MKHVLFGQKSVFLGDEAADALVDYAAHVAQMKTGDRVDMRGINSEGNAIVTTFLLNGGSNLAAETTSLQLDEPDNAESIAYIRRRIEVFAVNPDFFDGFTLVGELGDADASGIA